ncbi:Sulfur carrier protein FdhD [Candidatus Desulfarcum epimagneticum]|uniref:Sulfur carrier protein FdhD n=1 Tax=uncultured Desulfobacteraceae bacterium TaxID=218296 RepID=A0A484HEN7_9BACT|nr:Sulfur carrier protein FdhD [uncultured Desulfobacteraceae bacterium]
MDPFKWVDAGRWDGGVQGRTPICLIREEPLSIVVQGKSYSTVLRTPGDELPHAAGFCFSEGIIDHVDDCVSIACCDAENPNIVSVTLTGERQKKAADILERSGYISQTSCGLCGKEMADELFQHVSPVPDGPSIDVQRALDRLENLFERQPLHKKTRAAHAAVIYDSDFEPIAESEDAGRHNALDKSIGKALMEGVLDQAAFLVMSSRISYELVQKAGRARIPAIFSISRPTEFAASMATRFNISLACLAKGSGLYLYGAAGRLSLRP